MDDERSPWFDIINDMELFEMLGISSLHELSNVGYSVELTIKINNFTIMYNDGGAMNRAHVVEVLNQANIQTATEASHAGNEETVARGTIIGDFLYDGIAISRLFTEPFTYVLGEPLGNEGVFFSYDGLQIMGNHWGDLAYPNMAIQIEVEGPNLNLFELNGSALDMTRAELVAALGEPYEFRDDNSIKYHLSNSEIGYTLVFRFENTDDETEISSISIFQLDWQAR